MSRFMKLLLPVSTCLIALSGCSWFNDVGEHMPVVGQRCEYWQCFTAYGQQQSDLIRQAREKQAQPQGQTPAENPPPDPTVGGAAPTPQTAPAPSHVEYIDPSKIEPIDIPGTN